LLAANGQILVGAINTPFLGCFHNISREKILTSFKCFQQKFLGSKDLFFVCFKGLEKIKEKEKSLGLVFDLHIYSYFRSFLKSFSL